jgi:hypothetical protein
MKERYKLLLVAILLPTATVGIFIGILSIPEPTALDLAAQKNAELMQLREEARKEAQSWEVKRQQIRIKQAIAAKHDKPPDNRCESLNSRAITRCVDCDLDYLCYFKNNSAYCLPKNDWTPEAIEWASIVCE